ncbi:thioesterase II family protein [Nonomuraea turcica]|uniref:thioesterase II family protein n=1 Tax=Nonomuraea sp. G32 TaxID=3067274 RepID=UPI00273A7EDE|nr:alpha/beta fold hydrolase [Nonomuraea sp. G32]MDP4501995.1 alpha/beta fold hydrolase [Nonomuraea sp. G32]
MTYHDTASPARWFSDPSPRPGARRQLFCLPYAGAGASAFRGWAAAAGPQLEVLPVVLPGRESRYTEPFDVDIAELASAIAARADRPYTIYGHSMGGRLGFEVIRELRKRGERQPLRLCLGGCRPPDILEPLAELSSVSDEELLGRLAELGGLPAEILTEPELCELILPVLRADFTWLDTYEYEPEPPIEVPIVAFAGAEDHSVTPDDMRGWARHTTAGFDLRVEPGGHFFLHERRDHILKEALA